MTMQSTLLLNVSNWDLTVDKFGNIAVASGGYAVAQNVATALRTFKGECWYNTQYGIPYWQQILGKFPPLQYVKTVMENQAKTVPDVVSASVTFTSFNNRVLQGECLITTTDGQQQIVEF